MTDESRLVGTSRATKMTLGLSLIPRSGRAAQLVADILILTCAFAVAYELRFEFDIPHNDLTAAFAQVSYVVLIQLLALSMVGARSLIWRYVGMAELRLFVKAACCSAGVIAVFRSLLPTGQDIWRVPFSVIVMSTILGFGAVLGMRVLRRVLHETHNRRPANGKGPAPSRTPVLLIGAGSAGVMIAKEIQSGNRTDLEVRGFVDDDPGLQGGTIQGVRVLGTTRDLPRLVAALDIQCVVISIVADEPSAAGLSRRDVKRIRDICQRIPVKVRIVPAMHELLAGKVNVSQIRDIQVEDLLGREPVRLETRGISRLVEDNTVMVTGAGGSIGSELTRQVARFRPSRLLLVERAEPALFALEQELRASFGALPIFPIVGDVGDGPRMRTVLERYAPRVVLHAAAHKHVPLMESNPTEAIANNVLATQRLGELAGQAGVDKFVLISTDKAVQPTSVMGASKRMAEIVVQNLNERFKTRYMAVRFGNVIGSTGSVIPIFREQIRKGGPVTVTHPEMMRYFMTIPEAAQLVLQAAALGEGGEIFILDMGEPISILELAVDTIRLSGLEPFADIDIEFIGTRPGEKLVEELGTSDEEVVSTRHPKILIGKIQAYPDRDVREALSVLTALSVQGSERELCAFLNTFLPDAHLNVGAVAGATSQGASGHAHRSGASLPQSLVSLPATAS
jgi:FlaA1/EpsC-like NDP-sugar epimerase